MPIAHIPFGVTRPLLDGFWGTHSPKYASERVYAITPYGKGFQTTARRAKAFNYG